MEKQSTKEIFLDGCTAIAKHFEEYGFKYYKSGPKLKKVIGDLTFEIAFGTSYYNGLNYKVALDCHLWIKSKQFKKWKKTQPQCDNRDVVAHQGLQYVSDLKVCREWNLLESDSRHEVINEITDSLTKYALPYFELFESPALVAGYFHLRNGHWTGMDEPCDFIEYALCFLSEKEAKDMTITYLKDIMKAERTVEGLSDFDEEYETYKSRIISDNYFPAGHASQVAFYAINNGWGNLAKKIDAGHLD